MLEMVLQLNEGRMYIATPIVRDKPRKLFRFAIIKLPAAFPLPKEIRCQELEGNLISKNRQNFGFGALATPHSMRWFRENTVFDGFGRCGT